MNFKFQPNNGFASAEDIKGIIAKFSSSGQLLSDGARNKIKLFEVGTHTINIKSFKVPNLLNTVMYKYFRKSKARRSFEYANLLLSKAIGTPKPIAYAENFNAFGLRESFYVSEHLAADLTFRELVTDPNYPDHENILRQFTKFSFDLHQNGIEFMDHSPGNTLIQKDGENQYSFYLVDLNRMKFHDAMSIELRMKNLSRLTPKKEMVAIMANEYAKLSGQDESRIFQLLWQETSDFQQRYHKKIRLKKKLKFWK